MSHPFGASLAGPLPVNGFRMFASKGQNGFVEAGIVSSRCRGKTLFPEASSKKGDFNGRVYAIVVMAG
jgi:hypothetical protein